MANSKNLLESNVSAKKPSVGHFDSIQSDVKLFLSNFFKRQALSNPHLLVAFSGGLDSMVLLYILAHLEAELSFKLSAMHVHHGLSANADTWASFCEQTCVSLNIPFSVFEVRVNRNSGMGIEATAREARYQALSSAEADYVCLAHHQNDQAETLLLQLVRGAGVKGLASMPQIDLTKRLLRPLLNLDRPQLEQYAKNNQLRWIEDESNDNTQYDRNFMRREVIPLIGKRYPSVTQTLARSAAHLAEASRLLDELAQLDAKSAFEDTQQYERLSLESTAELSDARKANLLRWWLDKKQVSMPSMRLLQQVLQQLYGAKPDASIKLSIAKALHLMRYQGWAYLVREPMPTSQINMIWQGEEMIILPNLSRLFFVKKQGAGLAFQRLGKEIKLRIKSREGGERLKLELNRPARTLKHILQLSAVPPWLRSQLPLIYVEDKLAVVPNIGVDVNMQAAPHELGLQITWNPDQ